MQKSQNILCIQFCVHEIESNNNTKFELGKIGTDQENTTCKFLTLTLTLDQDL